VNLESLNIKISCLDSDAVEAKALITDANLDKYNLIRHDNSIGHLAQSKKPSKRKVEKAGESETSSGETTEEEGQVSPKWKKASRGIFEDGPSDLEEVQWSKPLNLEASSGMIPQAKDRRS